VSFQPAARQIVPSFLARRSQQIDDRFAGRAMPIHIQLPDEDSNDPAIDQAV
jgi:hypothetical protein